MKFKQYTEESIYNIRNLLFTFQRLDLITHEQLKPIVLNLVFELLILDKSDLDKQTLRVKFYGVENETK